MRSSSLFSASIIQADGLALFHRHAPRRVRDMKNGDLGFGHDQAALYLMLLGNDPVHREWSLETVTDPRGFRRTRRKNSARNRSRSCFLVK
jgi:hypothetical protein